LLTFADSLDPQEIKDFTHDWTASLAAGEAIVGGSVAILFVDAAGTSQPNAISTASNKTRVWLTGGTPGARCIFTLRASTNSVPARTIEESFAVLITETTTEVSLVGQIKADIAMLETAMMDMAAGRSIKEVFRNGRRLVYSTMSAADLRGMLDQKMRQLARAEAIAAGGSIRRSIPLAWPN